MIKNKVSEEVSEVSEERIVKLFCELVSKDSPSFGEKDVCGCLKEKLEALGYAPEEDHSGEQTGGNAGNLYLYIEGTGEKSALPPLLFCAHMDTVEPSCGKQAVVHPGGKITSAGDTVLGADDVSGLTAILEALTVLQEKKLSHRPIEILFSAAEEPYCAGIQPFDFQKLRSKEAYVLDLTGPVGGAALAAPTLLSFSMEFRGVSAHAGFAPEKGIHAIKAACRAANVIKCGHVDADTTVNIGTITGGKGDNIVPEECTVTGEVRSFDDGRALEVTDEIKKIAHDAAKETGAKVKFTSIRHITAYSVPEQSPVVQRFVRVCGREDLPVSLSRTHGGSDNNVLALHGITGIVLATAMNNCHSCGEYTSVEELVWISRLIVRLMISAD